ncbi:hypothetical protein [Deinococcus sp.]|uniref:hypothetical protein n=1 Tax=Deinococcus sp. TaxID=47478 RepID=UPI0025F052EA|nr:hypothetical protein [Deinococcus sp.]
MSGFFSLLSSVAFITMLVFVVLARRRRPGAARKGWFAAAAWIGLTLLAGATISPPERASAQAAQNIAAEETARRESAEAQAAQAEANKAAAQAKANLEPQPSISLASDLASMGKNPSTLEAAEVSTEAERYYYTWERPDIGEEVTTVWVAPDNWWIKISKPSFALESLGNLQGREFQDGPLKGIQSTSRISTVIHLETKKWRPYIDKAASN